MAEEFSMDDHLDASNTTENDINDMNCQFQIDLMTLTAMVSDISVGFGHTAEKLDAIKQEDQLLKNELQKHQIESQLRMEQGERRVECLATTIDLLRAQMSELAIQITALTESSEALQTQLNVMQSGPAARRCMIRCDSDLDSASTTDLGLAAQNDTVKIRLHPAANHDRKIPNASKSCNSLSSLAQADSHACSSATPALVCADCSILQRARMSSCHDICSSCGDAANNTSSSICEEELRINQFVQSYLDQLQSEKKLLEELNADFGGIADGNELTAHYLQSKSNIAIQPSSVACVAVQRRSLLDATFTELPNSTEPQAYLTTEELDAESECNSLLNRPRRAAPHEKLLKETLRNKVFQELIETERRFCSCLWTIIDFIAESIKLSNLVPIKDLCLMFPKCLPRLYEVHSSFLCLLEERVDRDSSENFYVSELVLHLLDANQGELFQLYRSYVCDFKLAIDVIRRYVKQNIKFRKLVVTLQHHKNCEGLDLTAFLLTPVQRVPRYLLLMKQIMNYTDPEHPDSGSTTLALARLQELLEELDESIQHALANTVISVTNGASRKSSRQPKLHIASSCDSLHQVSYTNSNSTINAIGVAISDTSLVENGASPLESNGGVTVGRVSGSLLSRIQQSLRRQNNAANSTCGEHFLTQRVQDGSFRRSPLLNTSTYVAATAAATSDTSHVPSANCAPEPASHTECSNENSPQSRSSVERGRTWQRKSGVGNDFVIANRPIKVCASEQDISQSALRCRSVPPVAQIHRVRPSSPTFKNGSDCSSPTLVELSTTPRSRKFSMQQSYESASQRSPHTMAATAGSVGSAHSSLDTVPVREVIYKGYPLPCGLPVNASPISTLNQSKSISRSPVAASNGNIVRSLSVGRVNDERIYRRAVSQVPNGRSMNTPQPAEQNYNGKESSSSSIIRHSIRKMFKRKNSKACIEPAVLSDLKSTFDDEKRNPCTSV